MAGQTATDLATRGFVVAGTGNATTKLDGTVRLSFGVNGIAAAYTLAAQFTDPILTFVAREDAAVDVTVGSAFQGLVAADAVTLDPTVALTGPEGCKPVEELLAEATTAPAAAETPAAPPAEG
ncbi:LytR C-terminal domain-containing protein [Cellulomonas soli]